MRVIKLTHQEIETIKTALQYVYDRKLELVAQNRKILGDKGVQKILEGANKYFDTQDVFNGERDFVFIQETKKEIEDDVDLRKNLSVRAGNVLQGADIRYVSDIIKSIRNDGRVIKGTGKNKGKIFYCAIIQIRGLGVKTYEEIMQHVYQYL